MDQLTHESLQRAVFAGEYISRRAGFGDTPSLRDNSLKCSEELQQKLAQLKQNDLIAFDTPDGQFQCLFHRTMPKHVSGEADHMPFKDASTLRKTFEEMNLPQSYLLISDGMPVVVQTLLGGQLDDQPRRCDFIAHQISKQFNWSLALRHEVQQVDSQQIHRVSAFWSVDDRTDYGFLEKQLSAHRALTWHPMLLPCIMFACTLERQVERRNQIKQRLRRLEQAIVSLSHQVARYSALADVKSHEWWQDNMSEVDRVLQDLHDCRKQQQSCQGRYHFWGSFHEAIAKGIAYAEHASSGASQKKACAEIADWVAILWARFESLKARDIDLVSRVSEAASLLNHVLQQREAQVQCSIARAALRDGNDMKFIALLGSVFLPAGLVASLLNIPQLQVIDDMRMLLVYIGVTLPLIGVVVLLCVLRETIIRYFQGTKPATIV